MRMQEIIHQFTEGSGSRLIKMVLVLFSMVGLAVWYDAAAFKNLATIEGMDAAQVARNLSEGRGYTTDFIRPLSLHLLRRHLPPGEAPLKENHPDLANAPLYPALLAMAMKVFPMQPPDLAKVKSFSVYQPDLWITIFNQIFFLLAVWMVWRLARRLFDEPVAWVTAAVFAGSELCWRFSTSGLSTMLLMVLMLTLVETLARLEPETREYIHLHCIFNKSKIPCLFSITIYINGCSVDDPFYEQWNYCSVGSIRILARAKNIKIAKTDHVNTINISIYLCI